MRPPRVVLVGGTVIRTTVPATLMTVKPRMMYKVCLYFVTRNLNVSRFFIMGYGDDLRKQEVEADRTNREWNTQELTGQDIKSKRLIDEEIIESPQTTDDECIENGQKEQQPSERIGERLNSLFLVEVLFSRSLIIGSDSFHEFDLFFMGRPASFHWGIWKEEPSDD